MKVKFNKNELFIFFFLLPCFKPTYFTSIKLLNNLYNIILIISFLIIILLYFKHKRKPSKIINLFIIYEIWIIFNTIIHYGNVSGTIKEIISILLAILVIDFYFFDIKSLLNTCMIHFEICIYINLITILVWPNGIYNRVSQAYGITKEWFLGWDNNFIIWLLPGICIAFLYKYYFKKRLRSNILIIAIIYTALISWVATALVGIGIILLCIYIPKVEKILTPIRTIIITILIFTFIVILRNFNVLEGIITSVLQKDMTLNSRTLIWDNALIAIRQNWIIGYGVLHPNQMIEYLGWNTATHCHSQYLQIIFQGGSIAIFIYIMIQLEIIKKIKINFSEKYVKILMYTIFAFNIMGISEPYNSPLIYIIFVFAYKNNLMYKQY